MPGFEIDETFDALNQPLDPALVSQRRGGGGRQLSYVKGHHIIDQANRIFGFNGWGYEIVSGPTLHTIVKPGQESPSYGYSATVRVDVQGCPYRMDVGFNSVADHTPDGHDTAIKGAVTDGMRRALRSFGAQFGNDLYAGSGARARESSPTAQEYTPPPEPPPPPEFPVCALHGREMNYLTAKGSPYHRAQTPDGQAGLCIGETIMSPKTGDVLWPIESSDSGPTMI